MTSINKFHQHHNSSLLEIHFSDGFNAHISYELLRVYSPYKAQTAGFTTDGPLVNNKAFVRLVDVAQSDLGASLYFDDGHRSNLYTTDYLYQLCKEQDELWLTYLRRSKLAQKAKVDSINCIQIG